MGKTGFLFMYMLVVPAIKKDLGLCPIAKFPDNVCMLSNEISGASNGE